MPTYEKEVVKLERKKDCLEVTTKDETGIKTKKVFNKNTAAKFTTPGNYSLVYEKNDKGYWVIVDVLAAPITTTDVVALSQYGNGIPQNRVSPKDSATNRAITFQVNVKAVADIVSAKISAFKEGSVDINDAAGWVRILLGELNSAAETFLGSELVKKPENQEAPIHQEETP